jgi:thiol:disulfide interchange protein DsbG
MQRRLFALTALVSLIGLSACQKQADTTAPATTSSPASTGGAPAAAPGGTESAAAAAVSTAQDAYVLAATGNGFSTGPIMSGHTVYVFFDTTCPHCAHLWQAAKEVTGQLKVVWIPVAFLRPQSLPQGATILGAADPIAAMDQNEASVANRGNGITASTSLDDAVIAKVKANTSMFKQLNSDSVPLIVYRNGKTGQVGQHAGAVTAAELLAFAGL